MLAPAVRVGLSACLLVCAVPAAIAQEAMSYATPSAPPTSATSSCSGWACLFGRPLAAAPAQQPATVAEATPLEIAQPVKPKAVRPVTIAASREETLKVKGLASAVARGSIRVVPLDGRRSDSAIAIALGDVKAGDVKLWREQMHVVARAPIHTMADLKRKIVSFGPAQGRAHEVARRAFDALNISVQSAELETDNALDGLATGDIDAVVIVGPQPVADLARLKSGHLLAWPTAATLPEGASLDIIHADAYRGLETDNASPAALAVDAVFRLSDDGRRQPAARALAAAIPKHAAALVANGYDLVGQRSDPTTERHLASAERH